MTRTANLLPRWVSRITLVLAALGRLAGSALASPPVPHDLEAQMAAASADQPLKVVVRFRPGREGAAVAQVAGRAGRRLALDGSVAVRLTREEIRRLIASGAVERIEADGDRTITRMGSQAACGATKARVDFGYSGDGDGDPHRYSPRDLTIAVIDTGIDGAHPELAGGKIIAWKDFVRGRLQPYDDHGHGTHVASIAAGGANTAGPGGVAPGASLIGLKAIDRSGSTSSSLIAQAVEWCITHKTTYGIDVINLSIGGAGSSDGTAVDDRMVNRAAAAGIVVCVAAGNEGPDVFSLGSPGAAAGAITVGNMADPGRGGFALHPSSSRGPTADGRVKPDLCAPGEAILAAQANTGGYRPESGTSMACPFVAGVVALMLDAAPALNPEQVKAILKQTSVHLGRPGDNSDFGAGRLDAYAALAVAAGRGGAAPDGPDSLTIRGALTRPGEAQSWNVPIDDTRHPLAATLIVEPAGADFDLEIHDPDGRLLTAAETTARQELASIQPVRTGVYRVVVVSYAGVGGYSLDLSADLARSDPAPPSGLSVRPISSARLQLTWVDGSGNETAFAVWRKGGAGDFVRVGVVSPDSTTFTDAALLPGTTYTYRVRAINNNGASAWCREATGSTLPAPPEAPSNLWVRTVSATQLDLAWTDRSRSETAFAVWRRSGAGDWARVGVVAPDVTTFVDRGLSAGAVYTYRVRAISNFGASAWSNETSGGASLPSPAAPTDLVLRVVSASRIDLTWTDRSGDETAFAIWRKSGTGDFTRTAVVVPNVTRYTDAGLSPNTRYTYRVRAIRGDRASGWSNEAQAGTPLAP